MPNLANILNNILSDSGVDSSTLQRNITLTTTGASGAATFIGNTLNIPNYLLSSTSPLSIASNVLSITKADATTDGYLSSTDWNYFSAKQQPLFGTGFVKATGSVISYDNTAYTPQSRTLTINGTAYDLSADRSWTISIGSGMRNVSSFVATAGQTTFTIVGGYTAGLVDVFVNGARLNSGDYTATNGTTVVLGTGVVANDIVDIINYTASLTSGITGSGTANYIPKWSGSSNLTNSIIYDNGFVVGINTATPIAGSTLTVNGQVYSKNGAFWTEDGQGYLIGDLSAGASYAFMSGVGSTGAASYLTFHTNYYEKMRIISNGNVGIGLTNPAYKLDVSGDINITGSFRINGVAITSGGGGIITGSGTTNYISKWSGSSSLTNSLIFDNGTNVGIGTSSPTLSSSRAGLVVRGNANGAELLVQSTSATNGTSDGFVIATIANHAYLYNRLNGNISIATNNLERILITSGGNVGINTASPSYKLQVTEGTWTGSNYTIYANGYSYFNGLRLNGGDTDRSIYQVNASSLGIATSGAYPILFFTNATSEVMRITSGGQLLVGVSSVVSNEKFRVIGSSNISGIARFENSQNQADLNHGVINIINTRTTYAIGNDASIMFSAYNSTLSMQPRASIGMKVSSDLGGDLVFNTRNNSSSGERMRIKESGVINFSNVPTSSAGLSSGDIYKSGSTLMIV